jgi:hypothetical protein
MRVIRKGGADSYGERAKADSGTWKGRFTFKTLGRGRWLREISGTVGWVDLKRRDAEIAERNTEEEGWVLGIAPHLPVACDAPEILSPPLCVSAPLRFKKFASQKRKEPWRMGRHGS